MAFFKYGRNFLFFKFLLHFKGGQPGFAEKKFFDFSS